MFTGQYRKGVQAGFVFALLLAFCGGLMLALAQRKWEQTQLARCHERFSLINPLRRCLGKPPPIQEEYDLFATELTAWIEAQKKSGGISNASVYFRDLQSGPWFGINEREYYSPASLLKVPIMVAVLKEAETNPKILSQEIEYDDQGSLQNVPDSGKRLQPGSSYTVRELMRRMIVNSDNASKDILEAYLSQNAGGSDILAQLYDELGLIRAQDVPQASLTVKGYASIMRMLYNASFLSQESSQYALELLAQTEFDAGIIGGLPPNLEVAHKFGSRPVNDQVRQLHDCGVVYYPGHDYLLCVMTQGKSDAEDARVIQHVSKAVYAEVDSRAAQEL